jgi:hypothetical protein
MSKPPKTPRPKKSPVLPPRENDQLILTIGMAHEKLIGRVAVSWSRLEGAMEDLIWHLLGLKIGLGRIVTSRMDATGKIRMLREVGELTLTEYQWHKLSPIIDRIDVLREERNTIIHGTWGRNSQGVPIALSFRPKPLAQDQVDPKHFQIRGCGQLFTILTLEGSN